jgi:hypothetical protein
MDADESQGTVLLGARLYLVCSYLAPIVTGASAIPVRNLIYKYDHLVQEFIVLIFIIPFPPECTGHGHGFVGGIDDILVIGIRQPAENLSCL